MWPVERSYKEGHTLPAPYHTPAPHVTFVPTVVPAAGALFLYWPQMHTDREAVDQPTADDLIQRADDLLLTGGVRSTAAIALPGPGGAKVCTVAGLAIGVAQACKALRTRDWDVQQWSTQIPATLRVWALAVDLADRLLGLDCVLPDLTQSTEADLMGVWRVAIAGNEQAVSAHRALARSLPVAGYAVAYGTQLGRAVGDSVSADDQRVWDPSALIEAFLDAVVDDTIRAATPEPRPTRPRERILPWTARWAAALTDSTDARVPLREGAAELAAGVRGWRDSVMNVGADTVAELRLVAPESASSSWELHFGVRTREGLFVAAEQVWEGIGEEQEVLLAGLARCARVFAPLESVLDENEPARIALDLAHAWQFIDEVADIIDGQVIVRLPEDLREGDLRIRLHIGEDGEGGARELGEFSDLDDVDLSDPDLGDVDLGDVEEVADPIDFASQQPARWEIALGEDRLDDDAVAELLSSRAPLVHWKGRWVRVDPRIAEQARNLGSPRSLPFVEALGLAIAGTTVVEVDEPASAQRQSIQVDVATSGDLHVLINRIRSAADRPVVDAEPENFGGSLRPYQQRGVAWLSGMAGLGLGGVLADDMGLGKTVQLIAHLLGRPMGPHLIVCPTSVVGNWQRELQRFAPTLSVIRHYGADRPDTPYTDDVVVVTSYGTLRRDASLLAETSWDVVTLDEAQFVKNPNTAGARAVRGLSSRQTVAMTGTPLENRLTELWSLLDATNMGLVGSRAAFARRYVTPIEHHRDPAASRRLRRLVAPFVLRREKTDPDVVADLPEKIERVVTCPMTAEQAQLYRRATESFMSELPGLDGMKRRGRILSLLTRLKQICNHPAQTSDDETEVLVGRSGKLETAREIVREAMGTGAQMLVYSQYVRMTALLARQLSEDTGVGVPVLHGGLSATARDRLVAGFQGELGEPPPIMVISLRAGGTGLNLTAASHVLHYDRWWNPAVEDQATDRAHRIGQTSTVEVHKLVTAGTLEERIADLLEHKRQLADAVVGSGESWITELGEGELSELIALSDDTQIMEEGMDNDEYEDPDAPSRLLVQV